MDRRTFLKRAGLGSVALGSLTGLGGMSAIAAFAEDEELNGVRERRHATFVAISRAPRSGNVVPTLAMEGRVVFSADAEKARGGGNLTGWDDATPVPKHILASGRWRVLEFVSYDTFDLEPYGRIQASILELNVALRDELSGRTGNGLLRLICNVGAGGRMTGEPEGFTLDPEPPFGKFKPVIGLTHISTPDNRPDE